MYCHHFQSSIRKCQEEERKGRTARFPPLCRRACRSIIILHNKFPLEHPASGMGSRESREGTPSGTFPPLCSPAWVPVGIKSFFIPPSWGPTSVRALSTLGQKHLVCLPFPCHPIIRAFFEDTGQGDSWKTSILWSQATGPSLVLNRLCQTEGLWKAPLKIEQLNNPLPQANPKKYQLKYSVMYVKRCSLPHCFNIKNCTQPTRSPVGNH